MQGDKTYGDYSIH